MKNLIVTLLVAVFLSPTCFAENIDKLKQECEQSVADSCTKVALYYVARRDQESWLRAVEYAGKDCDRGSASGCYLAGFFARASNKRDVYFNKAINLLKKSCDSENGFDCARLGVFYTNAPIGQDFKTANKYHQKACDLNEAIGCDELGGFYEWGRGATQSYDKAKAFYKKACDLGYGLGCSNLGRMYAYVDEKSLAKGRPFLEKGCNLKDGLGCYWLANSYANSGAYSKAAQYYEKGCRAKQRECCWEASHLYGDGKGVKKSKAKSDELYKKGNLYSDTVPRDFLLRLMIPSGASVDARNFIWF